MSDTKCTHCGASMHRLTRWCQRCGKSAGNPQIPISYPTIPAQNIKPNPIDILPATAQPEPASIPSAFSFAPQPAMPQESQTSSAFNFLPKSAIPEPSPSPSAIGSSSQALVAQAEQTQTGSAFNFLPKSVLPQSQPSTNSSFRVPEYAAVDHMAPADTGLDSSGVWRDGSMMVAIHDAVFPNRCVKCNDIAETERVTRKLYWHHPVIYLLLLFSPLVYGIVATMMRKDVTIDLPLCTKHKSSRKTTIMAGIAMLFLGVVLLVASFSAGSPFLFLIAILMKVVGAIVWSVGRRIVTPAKIENSYVWTKGVDREFLRQLPSV